MRQSPERRQQVLDEANRLIAEGGLPRLSMLELAQRLAMSKETLYAWFGSKDALLAELVGSNAAQAMAGLQRALERRTGSATALRAALREFCRELLQLLMSERSVALNRGAVHMAHTGSFGQVLRSQGRDQVLAQLSRLLAQAASDGLLGRDRPDAMAEVLIALCLRDWQIERLVGRMGVPDEAALDQRAREAVLLFMRLYANGKT